MHLEEAIDRLQEILAEMEDNQLPLHEVMKLHQEGNKLISHSEKLLKHAEEKLKVTEVGSVSEEVSLDGDAPSEESEIELF